MREEVPNLFNHGTVLEDVDYILVTIVTKGTGVERMLLLMDGGKRTERRFQFQFPSASTMSATLTSSSPTLRRPSMRLLIGPPEAQLSNQNLVLKQELRITFEPLSAQSFPKSNPLPIIDEPHDLRLSLRPHSFAQGALFSSSNLQYNLVRKAVFLSLAFVIPRPPNSLGRQTVFQLIRCSFRFTAEEPQRKSLLTLSIMLHVAAGRTRDYI
ncbi:putative ribonuclease H protein [Senna tora]|uniref:Putative ribonuclease H protein n=1 Tax=Senna tora TaxID=362788 RepID=A0A834TAW9_9FABA|nr:putative ribonuclease H protein [Senna tora]